MNAPTTHPIRTLLSSPSQQTAITTVGIEPAGNIGRHHIQLNSTFSGDYEDNPVLRTLMQGDSSGGTGDPSDGIPGPLARAPGLNYLISRVGEGDGDLVPPRSAHSQADQTHTEQDQHSTGHDHPAKPVQLGSSDHQASPAEGHQGSKSKRPYGRAWSQHVATLHAARVGFEPTERCRSAAFKAAALVHYATSPNVPIVSTR